MGRTSSAVKMRYNKKHYMEVRASLKIDLVNRFREKLHDNGDTQTDIIRKAVEEYVNKN
jgi:hypothetical protein